MERERAEAIEAPHSQPGSRGLARRARGRSLTRVPRTALGQLSYLSGAPQTPLTRRNSGASLLFLHDVETTPCEDGHPEKCAGVVEQEEATEEGWRFSPPGQALGDGLRRRSSSGPPEPRLAATRGPGPRSPRTVKIPYPGAAPRVASHPPSTPRPLRQLLPGAGLCCWGSRTLPRVLLPIPAVRTLYGSVAPRALSPSYCGMAFKASFTQSLQSQPFRTRVPDSALGTGDPVCPRASN